MYIFIGTSPPPVGFTVKETAVVNTSVPTVLGFTVKLLLIQTPRIPIKNSPVGQLWPIGQPTR
jgi:hypothetical protein